MTSSNEKLTAFLSEVKDEAASELQSRNDGIVRQFSTLILEKIQLNQVEFLLFRGNAFSEYEPLGSVLAEDDTCELHLTISYAINFSQVRSSKRILNVVVLRDSVEVLSFNTQTMRENKISQYSFPDFVQSICTHGSLWQMLFPHFHGIQVLSQSFSIPGTVRSALIRREIGAFRNESSIEDNAIADISQTFADETDPVISIEPFFQGQQKSNVQNGGYNSARSRHATTYQFVPQRSEIFNFQKPTAAPARNDRVISYPISGKSYPREFVAGSSYIASLDQELQRASFDILHMLAIRRSKIYRDYFSRRLYTILFPPIIDRSRNAIFPVLSLRRKPRGGFSGTITVSYWVLPINTDSTGRVCGARNLHISGFFENHREFRGATFLDNPVAMKQSDGPPLSVQIRDFWNIEKKENLRDILSSITSILLTRVICGTKRNIDTSRVNDAREIFIASGADTQMTSTLLQVEWMPSNNDRVPWESWMAGDQDLIFRRILYQTLFWEDHSEPDRAFSSERTAKLEEMNIGNALGVDMIGMTNFVPHETHKVCFYPKKFEQYPNYSIVRWAAWQGYLDAAVTSLRALIMRFSAENTRTGMLTQAIHTTSEMFEEFVDLYDLDLREYSYRREYERLRSAMNLDSDYQQLSAQVSAIKEDGLLREQRLINKLVVGLTLSTIAAAILTPAGVPPLSMTVWIILVLIGGYIIFDPIRDLLQLMLSILSWFRKR